MKTNADDLEVKIVGLIDSKRKLEKDIEGMRGSNLAGLLSFTEKDTTKIGHYIFVSKSLDNFEVKELRNAVQNYVRDNPSSIIILFSVTEEKISYVAAVSKDSYEHISALELVHIAADIFGTKGGGRNDLAQGGGVDSAKIPFVIDAIKDSITKKCAK
jgi:alanyl-tRNA synthetase